MTPLAQTRQRQPTCGAAKQDGPCLGGWRSRVERTPGTSLSALLLMALSVVPWMSVYVPGPLPPQRGPGELQPPMFTPPREQVMLNRQPLSLRAGSPRLPSQGLSVEDPSQACVNAHTRARAA